MAIDQTLINFVNSEKTEMDAKITEYTNAIGQLEAAVTNLNNTITDYESQITTLTSNISDLNTEKGYCDQIIAILQTA